jgi:predicted transcriptional regulator
MTKYILARRVKEFQEILSRWKNFYEEESRVLFNLLLKKGVSRQVIADELGVSLQAICQKYPKNLKEPHV